METIVHVLSCFQVLVLFAGGARRKLEQAITITGKHIYCHLGYESYHKTYNRSFSQGCGKGSKVALSLQTSPAEVVALLSILKIDGR